MSGHLPTPNGIQLSQVFSHPQALVTSPEAMLDHLVQLAAQICQTPIALITLLEGEQHSLKSHVGWSGPFSAAGVPLFRRVVLNPDLLLIQDALTHPDYATNSFVATAPHIRFFAGMPLKTPSGAVLGTLFVMDYIPRTLHPRQQMMLHNLSTQITAQLGLQQQWVGLARKAVEGKRQIDHLQQTNQSLKDRINLLEQQNREGKLLAHLSNVLQACLTLQESYRLIPQLVRSLLPDESGAVFMLKTSSKLAEIAVRWGENLESSNFFVVHECWALKQRRSHYVQTGQGLDCSHCHTGQTQAYCCLPLIVHGELLGLLHLSAYQTQFSAEKLRLAGAIAEHLALALGNIKLRELLQDQSVSDPLTGLYNRRHMAEALEKVIQRARRDRECVSIIMLDLDHFKRFNDQFGHQAGDAVLRDFSVFLKGHVRSTDIACRYGGEEFTLILPGTTLEVAQHRAEKLRKGIKYIKMRYQGKLLGTVTLSAGVATYPNHASTGEALIGTADIALYRAKTAGRDCVLLAGVQEPI